MPIKVDGLDAKWLLLVIKKICVSLIVRWSLEFLARSGEWQEFLNTNKLLCSFYTWPLLLILFTFDTNL